MFKEKLQPEMPAHAHAFFGELQKQTAEQHAEGNAQPVARIRCLQSQPVPRRPPRAATITEMSHQGTLHEALAALVAGNILIFLGSKITRSRLASLNLRHPRFAACGHGGRLI